MSNSTPSSSTVTGNSKFHEYPDYVQLGKLQNYSVPKKQRILEEINSRFHLYPEEVQLYILDREKNTIGKKWDLFMLTTIARQFHKFSAKVQEKLVEQSFSARERIVERLNHPLEQPILEHLLKEIRSLE
jgi:hypothetical protein